MAIEFYQPALEKPRPLTCFVYGAPRRAKTTFGGTFPSPVVLSIGVEGGDRTLQQLPGVTAVRINSRKDMEEAVRVIQLQHKQRGWQTVVVDSVTFYAELVMAEFSGLGKKGSETFGGKLDFQDWGRLESHLCKWLMPTLHALPMHVVWIALEKQITNRETGTLVRTEPMLSGQTAQKLPACCDLIVYGDTMTVVPQGGGAPYQAYIMRTAETGTRAMAGGRFGGAFSEGFIWPNFQAVADRIGPLIGVQPQAPASAPNQITNSPQNTVAAGGAH